MIAGTLFTVFVVLPLLVREIRISKQFDDAGI